MKKLDILFLGGLVAMGMVACDDKLPVAPPQANEQGPVLEGISGATAALTNSAIDLAAEFEDGVKYLNMYTVSSGTSGLPQSDIWGEIEISNSESFSQSVILPEYEGMVGTVSLDDLNLAHSQLFGVSPYEKTVYYRVLMYANVDGNTYRVGGTNYFGATGSYKESNYDPGFEIQETYYIIGVEGWQPSDCVVLSHSDESAYDDPVFTYTFSSEDAVYWKIVPPDVYEQVGQPGFNADRDFWPNIYSIYNDSKTLAIGNGPSGEIQPGNWTISVNMKELTWWITGMPAGVPDWVGTPNTSQGWNIGESMKLLPYEDYYKGFSYFGGEWGGKLAYTVKDSEIWLGLSGSATENTNDDGATYYEIPLSPDGGNIFEGQDARMYFINYNFPESSADFYPVLSCSIIGGFNDWSADAPLTAVADSDDMKWTGTFTFDSDTEFKFRFNKTWAINLGGDLTDLKFDAGNIAVKAGTYVITLDITNAPYSATIVAQ